MQRENLEPDNLPEPTNAEARAFATLIGLTRRLRAADGCAWDRKQTLDSLTPHFVEEVYELIDGIDAGDDDSIREELGDVVYLALFCAQIAEDEHRFELSEVLSGHARKIVNRHPHIFDTAREMTADEVKRQWEGIKREEKSGDAQRSILAERAAALPALTHAFRLQEKAAAVGFDWRELAPVRAKVEEEWRELAAEIEHGTDSTRRSEELGDLLFAIVNLARHLEVDPERALRRSAARFTQRFHHIERALAAAGRTPETSTLEEMDALWDEAKASEGEDGAAAPQRSDAAPEVD